MVLRLNEVMGHQQRSHGRFCEVIQKEDDMLFFSFFLYSATWHMDGRLEFGKLPLECWKLSWILWIIGIQEG